MWGVQPSREDKKMITEVGLKQKSHSQKRRGSQQFLKRLNSTSKLTFSPSVFDLIQNWFFLFFGEKYSLVVLFGINLVIDLLNLLGFQE